VGLGAGVYQVGWSTAPINLSSDASDFMVMWCIIIHVVNGKTMSAKSLQINII